MELDRIGAYGAGLYDVVDYGFGSFITRPIAEYVIAPVFRLMGTFIPNYGLVIILFACLIKLVLYPLTKSAYRSTARMREVQPKMEAIKEKYSDEPQKQQEAMMRLYKEEKINPLGGCLPLLLQYPIIIALWRFFQNSILIRQESFLWAADLSAPDPILQLPFTIPLYGDFVAGFCLIMGIAMVFQMRFSMPQGGSSNAQAKIFMYVLPVILFAVFNRLASGLSLYYLTYNVLTVFQQRTINKQIHAEQEAKEAGEDPKGKASANGRLNGRSARNGEARKRARRS
jgi:YidC/Oxa1 family membrane protein insertase